MDHTQHDAMRIKQKEAHKRTLVYFARCTLSLADSAARTAVPHASSNDFFSPTVDAWISCTFAAVHCDSNVIRSLVVMMQ